MKELKPSKPVDKLKDYAGSDIPDELRIAAVELLDACRVHIVSGDDDPVSTAEIMGVATIVLNEVTREVTYGLWEDGAYNE